MSFQPYSPAPTSRRARDAVSGDRERQMAAFMMGITKDNAETQNKLIEKSGKYGTVAPVGSSGFAGDRLASAIGSIGKAASGIGGLLNQGGSQPWYKTSSFNPPANSFPDFSGGTNYTSGADFRRFTPSDWNHSSTAFGS